jgi:hypothetical protein
MGIDPVTNVLSIDSEKLWSTVENYVKNKQPKKVLEIKEQFLAILSSEKSDGDCNGHHLVGVLYYLKYQEDGHVSKYGPWKKFATSISEIFIELTPEFLKSSMGQDFKNWFSDSGEEE